METEIGIHKECFDKTKRLDVQFHNINFFLVGHVISYVQLARREVEAVGKDCITLEGQYSWLL